MALDERDYMVERRKRDYNEWLNSYNPREFRQPREFRPPREPALNGEAGLKSASLIPGLARVVLILALLTPIVTLGHLNAWLPGATSEPGPYVEGPSFPGNEIGTLRVGLTGPARLAFFKIEGHGQTWTAFVKEGQTADIQLPAGSYGGKVLIGEHWYNKSFPFGFSSKELKVNTFQIEPAPGKLVTVNLLISGRSS